jgi:hypothetical protein
MRCLFVAFIFVSLAKPQLKSGLLRTGRLASVFMIIDNTYSMAYGENFEIAKKKAEELLGLYAPNSEFFISPLCQLKNMSGPDRPAWVTKKSAVELIKKIELSYKAGKIKDALLDLSDDPPRYRLDYIYVGDGQVTNFKDFPEKMNDGEFFWLKMPAGSNLGITKVFLKDPVAHSLDNYDLEVTVENYSANEWSGRIGLTAGDYHFEKDCEVRPYKEKSIEFSLPVSVHKGKVELYDDSLAIDNAYYFSKSLFTKLKILTVGSNKFLIFSLNPGVESRAPFYVESINNLGQVDLRKFDVIIIDGIYEISESDKIKLESFLNQKQKAILCFLGDEVGYNLGNLIARCCEVEEMVLPKGYVTLDWIDYKHPVFNIFVGSLSLKNIKFYSYHKVTTQGDVIAKLGDDHPLIVIKDNLAVITTQFASPKTDIVYSSAFVPLVFRLVTALTTKSLEKEFYVGEVLTMPNGFSAPTGEYIAPQSEFLIPGFYTSENETIAINVLPQEGNLNILGSEIEKILNIHTIDTEMELSRSDLSKIFLYLALFALLSELILLVIY